MKQEVQVEHLKRQVFKRTELLQTVQQAYERDVLIVKRYLEEYHPHIEGLQAVPSLDIRPLLPFFSPESCFLKVDPCEKCGGMIELIHRDTDTVLDLRHNLDGIEASLRECQKELRVTKELREIDKTEFQTHSESLERSLSRANKTVIEQKEELFQAHRRLTRVLQKKRKQPPQQESESVVVPSIPEHEINQESLELKKKLRIQMAKVDMITKRNTALKDNLSETRQSLENVKMQNKALKEQLEKLHLLVPQVDEMRQVQQKARAELTACTGQWNEDCQALVSSVHTIVVLSKTANESLKRQLSDVKYENEGFSQELDCRTRELAGLQNRLKLAQIQVTQEGKKTKTMRNELKEAIRDKMRVVKELEGLKDQLENEECRAQVAETKHRKKIELCLVHHGCDILDTCLRVREQKNLYKAYKQLAVIRAHANGWRTGSANTLAIQLTLRQKEADEALRRQKTMEISIQRLETHCMTQEEQFMSQTRKLEKLETALEVTNHSLFHSPYNSSAMLYEDLMQKLMDKVIQAVTREGKAIKKMKSFQEVTRKAIACQKDLHDQYEIKRSVERKLRSDIAQSTRLCHELQSQLAQSSQQYDETFFEKQRAQEAVNEIKHERNQLMAELDKVLQNLNAEKQRCQVYQKLAQNAAAEPIGRHGRYPPELLSLSKYRLSAAELLEELSARCLQISWKLYSFKKKSHPKRILYQISTRNAIYRAMCALNDATVRNDLIEPFGLHFQLAIGSDTNIEYQEADIRKLLYAKLSNPRHFTALTRHQQSKHP